MIAQWLAFTFRALFLAVGGDLIISELVQRSYSSTMYTSVLNFACRIPVVRRQHSVLQGPSIHSLDNTLSFSQS